MKNELPKVSVIIPAYNAEKYIAETIESVLAQNYPNIELIIVNDGSTDSTEKIIKDKYPSTNYIYQKNSGGCSSPRNKGLKYSSGSLINFFDADDIMAYDKISNQVKYFDKYPDIDAVFFNYRNFTYDNFDFKDHFKSCDNLKKIFKENKNHDVIILNPEISCELLIKENFSIAGSPIFKKNLIEKLGGYDEFLKASEDYDLHYRVATISKIAISKKIGFYRRLHDDNMSENIENIILNKIKSRKKHLNVENRKTLKRLLKKNIMNYYLLLARFYIDKQNIKSICMTLSSLKYGAPNLFFIKNIIKSIIFHKSN